MNRFALCVLAFALLLSSTAFGNTLPSPAGTFPSATNQSPKKQQKKNSAKGKQKPQPKKKKQQPQKKSAKAKPKPAPAAKAKSKTINKVISGIVVSFPGEPTVRSYDESTTYTLMTATSALTVMHLQKIKTDGELVYFSPEYKNSEGWKQEVMAYQELQKIGQNHLKLPGHWKATDYKSPLGKRPAATYKVDKPKPRRGRIISFLEKNECVVVQVVTMKPGQAGEKERNAFLLSVKGAAQ